MPFSSPALAADPRFFFAVQQGARALLQLHDEDPRVGALFSSQQRWLMCHAGYALACTDDAPVPANGLYAARFIELITEKNIASRNTAADFIEEIVGIGFARPVEQHGDRRKRLLQLTEVTHRSMSHWLELHLSLLDNLDGGSRAERYRADPAMIRRLQPAIAGQLIEVRGVAMGINIGTDNLRFLNPVRSGSRIRGVGELVKADEAKSGVQAVVRVTVEIEGEAKPACVVDTISRFYPAA